MKKLLLFVAFIGCFAMLSAQTQVSFKYGGQTYSDGDTINLYVEPTSVQNHDIKFHNNTRSRLDNLTITFTPIEEAGIEVWGLCAGAQCVQVPTSDPFSIPPSADYEEFSFEYNIAQDGNSRHAYYNVAVGNSNFTSAITLRIFADHMGIAQNEGVKLVAYPNPAVSSATISYTLSGKATIAVCDMQGRVVRRMPVEGTGKVVIDNLPAGVYGYGIIDGQNSCAMQRLIMK